MDLFSYRDHEFFCEAVPVANIAKKVGTPCYVYSAGTLRSHFRAFDEAFSPWPRLVCFAVKACGNLAVLDLLASLGAGADIVSGGELFRALLAGIPPKRIVYSGVGKTEREIGDALSAGILMFNVESIPELETIRRVARRLKTRAPVSFRVNPDVDAGTHPYISTGLRKNKFGIPAEQVITVYRNAAQMDEIEIVGIDCHIGSQLTTVDPFVDAMKRIRRLAEEIEEAGIRLRYLDIGGGLGVRYRDETPPSPKEYAEGILEVLSGLSQTLILEPGRAMAANAGVLITRVLYVKDTGEKRFAIVDAAMNDLARPSLYGAYHEIVPGRKKDGPLQVMDVVGPICETGDFLARDRELPPLGPKELLVVKTAGAYGFSMSSNYNARPRAAEVLVDGDRFEVVRRRETYRDLVRGERISTIGREEDK